MGVRLRRLAIALLAGLAAIAIASLLLPAEAPLPVVQRPAVGLGPVASLPELRQRLTEISSARFQSSDRAQTRRYLTAVLQDYGWRVTQQPVAGGQAGVNLIATQPGQAVAQSLVVGAHYDTVAGSPGADDNGTGVVALLEVARRLGHSTAPVPLTLVFFDLEEAGLLGSRAFVVAHPDVSGAVILEMLGFRCTEPGCQRYPAGVPARLAPDTGTFLAAVGDRPHRSLVDRFGGETPLPVVTLSVPVRGALAPDLLRSDHVPFWEAGIGAVMLTDTANFRNPHYHQPSDQVDTLDLPFFSAAVQLIVDRVEQLRWTQGEQERGEVRSR
ncbi:MAG: M28 family peptidase [Cyanobacteria bacterium P01_A01_bin.135]